MEFPRLVYKSAAVHMGVADAKEHAAALNDGWFDSVPDAIAKKHTAPPPAAPAPVPPEVAAILADLDAKDEAAVREYAEGIGLKVAKKATKAEMLDAVKAALTTAV